ncbi:hypothetical protein A2U01_0065170, partial [Trifolium medium]|nr:hypothetical protein [Trifolium medium]
LSKISGSAYGGGGVVKEEDEVGCC